MDIQKITQNQLKAGTTEVQQCRGTVTEVTENTKSAKKEIIKDSAVKQDYTAISKDGDTLEISMKSAGNTTKMTDAALAKCTKTKLKQLLSSGQITKQQYEKAVKGK